jgi:8-oxo-dGTP pyrophosphatase MutT (NUDIX family)
MKEKIKSILRNRPWERLETEEYLTPAAVLIPLFCKHGAMHLLFTERTTRVRHHKGQISFPGGARHDEDTDLLDTALRETFEEVGVAPEDVEVLGRLDQSRTITNYVITPFLGLIPYPYPFVKNPFEVEQLIEVPLSYILDDANLVDDEVDFDGTRLVAEQYRYNGIVIWGATLRILHQLRKSLGRELRQETVCADTP